MTKWIVDIWTNEKDGWVNYAISEIEVEDYLDAFLEGRTLFASNERAEDCVQREIEKNYSNLEKYDGDSDIPAHTYKL